MLDSAHPESHFLYEAQFRDANQIISGICDADIPALQAVEQATGTTRQA